MLSIRQVRKRCLKIVSRIYVVYKVDNDSSSPQEQLWLHIQEDSLADDEY